MIRAQPFGLLVAVDGVRVSGAAATTTSRVSEVRHTR